MIELMIFYNHGTLVNMLKKNKEETYGRSHGFFSKVANPPTV